MKRTFIPLAALALSLLLAGCGGLFRQPSTLGESYPRMYSDPPASILILPPVNLTGDERAGDYFACTLAEAVGLKGYYVFPVETSFAVLRDQELYTESRPDSVQLAQINRFFQADAVLITTLYDWGKSYGLLSPGYLAVDAGFELRSLANGSTLWEYRNVAEIVLGSDENNVIAAMIDSAIKTARLRKFPETRRINIQTFRKALPYGRYHPKIGANNTNPIEFDKQGSYDVEL